MGGSEGQQIGKRAAPTKFHPERNDGYLAVLRTRLRKHVQIRFVDSFSITVPGHRSTFADSMDTGGYLIVLIGQCGAN